MCSGEHLAECAGDATCCHTRGDGVWRSVFWSTRHCETTGYRLRRGVVDFRILGKGENVRRLSVRCPVSSLSPVKSVEKLDHVVVRVQGALDINTNRSHRQVCASREFLADLHRVGWRTVATHWTTHWIPENVFSSKFLPDLPLDTTGCHPRWVSAGHLNGSVVYWLLYRRRGAGLRVRRRVGGSVGLSQ